MGPSGYEDIRPETRAAKLFDNLFGSEKADPVGPTRRPLQKVPHNVYGTNKQPVDEPNVAAKKKKDAGTKHVLFLTPPVIQKKSRVKGIRKKDGQRKQVNMKEAVLEAFKKSNLPDYESIAQQELFISEAKPWERKEAPKPATPPMRELLKVFEETIESSRNTTRVSPVPSPVSNDSIHSNVTVTTVGFERNLRARQNLASTPLLPDGTPFRPDKKLNCRPFLQPNRYGRKDSVLSKPIPIVHGDRRQETCHSPPIQLSNLSSLLDSDDSESETDVTIVNRVADTDRRKLPSYEPSYILQSKDCVAIDVTATDNSLQQTSINSYRPKTNSDVPAVESCSKIFRSFHVSVGKSRMDPSLLNITALHKASISAHHSLLSRSPPIIERSTMVSKASSCRILRRRTITPLDSEGSDDDSEDTLKNITINSFNELKSILHESLAAAFRQTKKVFDDGQEEVLTSEEKVLILCDPQEIVDINLILTPQVLETVFKIGEGSYGEVFKTEAWGKKDLVLKVVPFNQEEERETIFSHILPELMICSSFKSLVNHDYNSTPNFIDMMRASCVRGSFPQQLISEWDAYDSRKGSENEDPRVYGEDHLHLIMALNNGGTDLEKHQFFSSQEALSIFRQVSYSLAAAESEFEFEHRDLHWGNILVSTSAPQTIKYLIRGEEVQCPTHGVMASIIDFSLSRMKKDGFVVHTDLSEDEDLFSGQGDYQFEVYRMMRRENKNSWLQFNPKSNIFWLHYMVSKLLTKKYKSRSKAHLTSLKRFQEMGREILSCSSALDLVRNKSHLLNDD